jgi:hypothetical protein
MRSYLNGSLYSPAYPRKISVACAYPRKCLSLARSNDLVSNSLQIPFAYPWTSLLLSQKGSGFQESTPFTGISMDTFNTQRLSVCKNRISAETSLPVRFLETAYMLQYNYILKNV